MLVMDREKTDEITSDEAAHMLGISKQTLLRRLRDGEISPAHPINPQLKRPQRVTFWREDVERLRDNPPRRGE